VKQLLTGQPTTFTGKYFDINGYQLTPADAYRPRPLIYGGGESELARNLIAEKADVFFLNGRPPEEALKDIEDLDARTHDGDEPLRYAMAAFAIARDTDEEAAAALAQAYEYAELDKPQLKGLKAGVDPESVMLRKLGALGAIGTNGGTAAGLVGSYDTVARRVREFQDLGVELLMLQFQPFEAEMRRFAEHVIPRVRALEPASS
jgi:alkanesulfonate monooxygenase